MRIVEHRGKWAIRIEGKRLSTGYDATEENRGDAERQARKILAARAKESSEGLAEIMEAYAQDRESIGKDGIRCRTSWNALKPHFDGLEADDVSRELCRNYAASRGRDGISDGTIIRDLKILHAACAWNDKKHNGIFWYPQEPEPRDRTLTKSQVRALIDAAEAHHIKVFLELSYATAARAGAILSLPWMNVHFEGAGHINLGTKANGKRRATVPMTARLREVLEAAYAVRETGHVIEYAGARVKSVRTGVMAACRRAKIRNFRIHDMRHTSAVHMAGDGVAMERIQQYLGHSHIGTTIKYYARYQPEHMRDAANALEL